MILGTLSHLLCLIGHHGLPNLPSGLRARTPHRYLVFSRMSAMYKVCLPAPPISIHSAFKIEVLFASFQCKIHAVDKILKIYKVLCV